jgi:hypothetical protein
MAGYNSSFTGEQIDNILNNSVTTTELEDALSNKQGKIIQLVCDTAAATVAKVVTELGYTLTPGDLISIKFTLGNTASSPTLNINGTGVKAIRIGGGAPTGASGTGAAYNAANTRTQYFYDGEYFYQLGSNDITDSDTTAIASVYGAVASQYIVHENSVASTATCYYPFVGIAENGKVEKISDTTSGIGATARTFTTNPISLFDNILFGSGTTTGWTKNAALALALLSRYSIGTTNWKYAIGQYYDKAGVLQPNTVTTNLIQNPVYLGGIKNGNYFVPKEFSLTLRDTTLVYKRIGFFTTVGSFYLTDYQPVFEYKNNKWVIAIIELVENKLSQDYSNEPQSTGMKDGIGNTIYRQTFQMLSSDFSGADNYNMLVSHGNEIERVIKIEACCGFSGYWRNLPILVDGLNIINIGGGSSREKVLADVSVNESDVVIENSQFLLEQFEDFEAFITIFFTGVPGWGTEDPNNPDPDEDPGEEE